MDLLQINRKAYRNISHYKTSQISLGAKRYTFNAITTPKRQSTSHLPCLDLLYGIFFKDNHGLFEFSTVATLSIFCDTEKND